MKLQIVQVTSAINLKQNRAGIFIKSLTPWYNKNFVWQYNCRLFQGEERIRDT